MNIEGQDEERAAFVRALEEGLSLFNERRFVDAYECWAQRWHEETTDGADLLQGLIQVAVAFAKLEGGEAGAAHKLLGSGVAKLQTYGPRAFGLDLDEFVGRLVPWQTRVREMAQRRGQL